jgi:hypothetical protein
MAWQYLDGNYANEVGPSANGGRLVLMHEPHRFYEIDQEHNGLLAEKSNTRRFGSGSLLVLVHRITVDLGRPRARSIVDALQPWAKWFDEKCSQPNLAVRDY